MTSHHTVISVEDSSAYPKQLSHLENLLKTQWGTIDPLLQPGVPKPVLALDSAAILLGGLTFTHAPSPIDDISTIWINTVLVIPEHRGKGVASLLIRRAEQNAAASEISTLFVYSEVPDLYIKLGWRAISKTGGSVVLQKELHT